MSVAIQHVPLSTQSGGEQFCTKDFRSLQALTHWGLQSSDLQSRTRDFGSQQANIIIALRILWICQKLLWLELGDNTT